MTAARIVINEIKGYHRFIKFLMVLVGAAAVASAVRFIFGLGATTNLNDLYPWGLWISFDVVTAVPLAAGAFTIGIVAHVFHIKKLEPLVRPAIVTGFLGYSLVCVGLLLDLGQPQRGPYVLFNWNVHSPMFEVSMCVMAYTTVLFLEFLHPVSERFGWHIPLRLLRTLELPFAILAAMISTLHQSTLGTFFLIAVDKLHNLWYNPLLPLQFWLSAIFTGLSIVIFEASLVHKYMGQPDESDLLATLTKIIPWIMGVYIAVKAYALAFLSHGPLFDRPVLTALFSVEVIVGLLIPFAMFLTKRIRTDKQMQLRAASLVIVGLILNRFNVSMFAMHQPGQPVYFPNFIESVVTIGIIAAHILFFVLIAKYFPIFEHHPEATDYTIPDRFRKIEKHGHGTASEA
ncbi:Ni/Fe-hydrogenase cytochrome b subunit [Geobacter sulfurreducens]|jgi:Ni/Fe-hydrogenase subunit HybB-like protein|uniref:Periplasmically oriented, membrane-bound formate dehydrogenase, b-type cytochrome subunit, putative n=1 Tax=Geobacter sulfurreducens (strain ATCC 51573 / DSM 12127 / PCA) TaxID=243231 RepID=Q74F30_GEOSL|nr:Ni/Fe-hydrogenase cytochrome b subunit [Geobacter sulfurreducens]AAR34109.1 periplasmically oriented, membrane-bound formate dehydrogenase, b-type cytochrome subunit, putative [Geobacter sulfurreducens PCA]ADI83622.1 periplasmically oriented, membrane-bound formate dehydrogenase, cytochrome b subunit [Geobacter sulfurreducens KN400]QVW36030.1 Ni/Fe-hydrogenase cytochrome b subunit [Geobacter sulfurreducens]UAC04845.1 Ni/Fe-hydrogenase cytochrome b subunit [Geobacter sulfurreducens]UTG93471.